jgi:cell division protein FtsB
MMRSSLNEGFSSSQPANSFYQLAEQLEAERQERQKLEQLVIQLAARVSQLEEKNKLKVRP